MDSKNDAGCIRLLTILGGLAAIVGVIIAIFAWLTPFSPVGPSPFARQPGTQPTTHSTLVPPVVPKPVAIVVSPTPPQTRAASTAIAPPEQKSDILTPEPRIYDFFACLQVCNENNATRSFPEHTKRIYLQWNYENIPIGAHYVRTWTMNGKEWVRYDCTWPGPETGIAAWPKLQPLTEPNGLCSGNWELTISVNEQVLLHERIFVEGNWNYWEPVRKTMGCYETESK